MENATFGQALEEVKAGRRCWREGWNGKGMWIAMTPGSTITPNSARPGHAAWYRAREMEEGLREEDMDGVIEIRPRIDMRAADGSLVVGWVASQADMLAEDWCSDRVY